MLGSFGVWLGRNDRFLKRNSGYVGKINIPLCHLRDISPILVAKFWVAQENSPPKIGGVPLGKGYDIV